MSIDRNDAIKRIKSALKKRSGKDWSVTGGKGTAWGWIEIDAPPRRRTWRHVQTDSPVPPSAGAIYRGAGGITPHYHVEDRVTDDPEADRQITCIDQDPWAREAIESGRSVRFDWEVEDPSYEFGHMSPADRVELARLLGMDRPVHYQGQSIAAGSDYREEYVARAEGRPVEVFGTQYWD
jgi:hypothetical protein